MRVPHGEAAPCNPLRVQRNREKPCTSLSFHRAENGDQREERICSRRHGSAGTRRQVVLSLLGGFPSPHCCTRPVTNSHQWLSQMSPAVSRGQAWGSGKHWYVGMEWREGPGGPGEASKESWPLLPLSQGQRGTLCVKISHKQLLDPKSHSSLGWCHNEGFLTHGVEQHKALRDPLAMLLAHQMLWGEGGSLLPGGWDFKEGEQ